MDRRRTATETLFRGDSTDAVAVPDPASRTSIVEHILYLGGYGRETPFTSVTESEDAADHFAGSDGAVWLTAAPRATAAGAKHWSRRALLDNLRGFGKGRAKWRSAWDVAQARRYVAEWAEHLVDWSGVEAAEIGARIKTTFDKRGKRRGR